MQLFTSLSTGFSSWSERVAKRLNIDAPSVRKAVFCFFFLFICTPVGHLVAWIQFQGYEASVEEYHEQQDKYHEQFMSFLADYLPAEPEGDDMYHATLRELVHGMNSAVDAGTNGIAWIVDHTLSLSTTTMTYILDAWKAFKIYFFSWVYGVILYLVSFSILTDLITQKLQHRLWLWLHDTVGWKLKQSGFLFGALFTALLWFTPIGTLLEEGFNAIHWITYDVFYG